MTTVEIPLGGELVALVDVADAALVAPYRWHAKAHGKSASGRTYYAHTSARSLTGKPGAKIRMHRLLLDVANGLVVDHINGNGLDNRRANLRICTHFENMRNRRLNANNSTGFKGVTRDGRRFRASVSDRGRRLHVGTFEGAVEAARAYDAAAIRLHGEFARLNFPETAAGPALPVAVGAGGSNRMLLPAPMVAPSLFVSEPSVAFADPSASQQKDGRVQCESPGAFPETSFGGAP